MEWTIEKLRQIFHSSYDARREDHFKKQAPKIAMALVTNVVKCQELDFLSLRQYRLLDWTETYEHWNLKEDYEHAQEVVARGQIRSHIADLYDYSIGGGAHHKSLAKYGAAILFGLGYSRREIKTEYTLNKYRVDMISADEAVVIEFGNTHPAACLWHLQAGHTRYHVVVPFVFFDTPVPTAYIFKRGEGWSIEAAQECLRVGDMPMQERRGRNVFAFSRQASRIGATP